MARMYPLRQWNPLARQFRVKRFIRWEDGARLVKTEKATEFLSAAGRVMGFDLVGNPEVAKSRNTSLDAFRAGLQTDSSCVAISRAEVEANAGVHGPSQTADLTEEQKAERLAARIRRGWRAGAMDDFVELAKAKVAAYDNVH